jgi:transcriptional regulator with XRE-family HTH domain
VWVSVVIGKRIREKRLKVGLSQRGLADVMGKCPSSVAKWEQGRAVPQVPDLAKLARTLRCTVAFLLGGGA